MLQSLPILAHGPSEIISCLSNSFMSSAASKAKGKSVSPSTWGATAQSSKSSSEKTLERPARPLNAYNLFFSDERKRLLESLPECQGKKPRSSHGKIGFADMARTVSKRWKSISEEEKAHYVRRAEEEKQRYYQAMNEWYRKNNEDDDEGEEKEGSTEAAATARTSPTVPQTLQIRSGSPSTLQISGPIAMDTGRRVASPPVPVQQTSLPVLANTSNDVLLGNLEPTGTTNHAQEPRSDFLASVGGNLVSFQMPEAPANTFLPSSIQPLGGPSASNTIHNKNTLSTGQCLDQQDMQDFSTALSDFLNGEGEAPNKDSQLNGVIPRTHSTSHQQASALSLEEHERLSQLALTLGNEELQFFLETFGNQ